MNKTIAKIGSIIVVITVVLFAAFLLISDLGSYFVCIFIALGYLLMLAGFQNESCKERKVAANAGLLFGCIYAVLIPIGLLCADDNRQKRSTERTSSYDSEFFKRRSAFQL